MEVTKPNDQKLHGLTFRREGLDAAPTIYLDDFYERFQSGETMGRLVKELRSAYLDSMGIARPQVLDLSYDQIKDKLTVRLLEIQRNRDYLSQTPYMTVGNGLAMVCDIKMGNGRDGSWRATITQAMLEDQGYDKRELFMAAMENAPALDPPLLADMSQALFSSERENLLLQESPLDKSDVGSMYVLTNDSGVLGSAALFYPGTREQVAELLGEGYTVLPSSQHEVLIVPDSAGIDRSQLTAMVQQANRDMVEPKDILSDNIYHFDKEAQRFAIATEQPQMSRAAAEAGRW